MPSQTAPTHGLNYGWSLGESGWNVQVDENWLAVDGLICLNVLSATENVVPPSPDNGDRYLVPSGATGSWATNIGSIARYRDGSWDFFLPKKTWEVRALDTGQSYYNNGSSWVLSASLLGQYANDTAAASANVPLNGTYINSSTGALTVRLS